MTKKSNDPNHPDNKGPIQDDGTRIGFYEERRRRSFIRNPDRVKSEPKKDDKDKKDQK